MSDIIPVILFAYARPDHLRRTLECLRADQVPLIYAFSDGPKTSDKQAAVEEVRTILKAINWCDVILVERKENLGLGRSILTGVTEVLKKHESILVFEDDLICVEGTYNYLCQALNHYQNTPNVLSVTGWTHPGVIPTDVTNLPYFDGRAESLVWGTWARSWRGMEKNAKTLMEECAVRGLDPYRYGSDLPDMAVTELKRNIWAVRWLYLHILTTGLCLRPPHSMVEHIGFDSLATNASTAGNWSNPPLQVCPPLPSQWPAPEENPQCPILWRNANAENPGFPRRILARILKSVSQIKNSIAIHQ